MLRDLATIRFLSDGQYRPDTNWIWWKALLATALILATSMSAIVVLAWTVFPPSLLATGWGLETLMLLFSVMVAWATVKVARWNNYGSLQALHLNAFAPTWPIVVLAVFLFALDNAFADALCRSYIAQCNEDQAIMVESLRDSAMPLALFTAIVVAPIWEEVLFRGFLQSAISKSRIGFWWGSVLITLAWAGLHTYSLPGTIAVASSGIVLTYLLWRTNSILPGIAYHMAMNAIASLQIWTAISP